MTQTLTADLRLGPDCSLTEYAVVLDKLVSSLHAPSQRTVLTPKNAGNYRHHPQYHTFDIYTVGFNVPLETLQVTMEIIIIIIIKNVKIRVTLS